MIDPQKLWSSSQLPTLPGVAIRLLELSKSPDAAMRDVIELVRSDPAIATKILRSTNSSYFGFRSPVTSLERAIPLLGTTVVTSLALSFSLVDAAMTSGPLARHYRHYWLQSLVQAAAAEILRDQTSDQSDCDFFLAGLLIDLGRLAMLKTVGEEYQQVLDASEKEARPLHELEQEVLGINHVEIGVGLMERWGFPKPLIEATRLHHAPLEQVRDVNDRDFVSAVRASAVAAAAGDYFCSAGNGAALERLTQLVEMFYDRGRLPLDRFLEKVKARSEEAGTLFSMKLDKLPNPAELMAQANEQLAQLAVREHVASVQARARQEAVEQEKQSLEQQNQELQKRALHDPLTRLYNRRFFDEALENEARRCCRAASSIGIVFIDLDHFKQLNDTYGHPFGDKVLQQVAQALVDAARRADILARYGGEEFVLLAAQPTEKGLRRVAERIRAAIAGMPVAFEGKRIPVTASIGAAIAVPRRNESDLTKRLVTAADEAMYDSKRNGRNQVHLRCLTDDQSRQLLQRATRKRFSRWLVNRGILDIPTVSRALLACETPHVRLGTLALQQRRLTADQIRQILEDQVESNERFGEVAVRLGLLSQEQLAQLMALQQEEPIALGRVLVRLGLLDRPRVAALLKEYFTESTSRLVVGVPLSP